MARRVEVNMALNLPDNVTAKDISSWLDFKLGGNGSIPNEIYAKFPDDLEADEFDWHFA